jgi:hypothetical protein
MSALAARELVRGWAEEIAAETGAPFYDTINRDQNPSDAVWWTMEFFAGSNNGATFCRDGYLEEGVIDLIFMGEAGTGDAALLTAAEAAIARFVARTDPDERLKIESYAPIAELTRGDGDPWYGIACSVSYTWRAG